MLQTAETKLGAGEDVRFQLANFEDYEFDSVYDAAVSSLALHHLVGDDDKIKFYKKIYACLTPGGVFYNADMTYGLKWFLIGNCILLTAYCLLHTAY
jgi:tRNA (cmo5U34)-methyltransferase